MIRITNYDVGQADCFLLHFEKKKPETDDESVENDDKNSIRYFNLLIDGGYAKDKVENRIKEDLHGEKLHGIVVTHIDSDHISGILNMVRSRSTIVENAFLIFNQYDETLISYDQAKNLMLELKRKFKENTLIKSYAKSYSEEDNEKINSKIDVKKELEVNLMSVNQRKKLTSLDREKVNITMLGPGIEEVRKFMRNWHDDNKNAEIINASSVVLLIEFDGKAILMPGDGYFSEIEKKLKEIEINKIDVIKAAHHGAEENNIRLPEIAKKYQCGEILFTIKGDKNQKHPDISLLKQLTAPDDAGNRSKLYCSAEVAEALGEYITTKKETIIEEGK